MAQESAGPWSRSVDWCRLVLWLALVCLGLFKSIHLCLNHILLLLSDFKRWRDNKKAEENQATSLPPFLRSSPSIRSFFLWHLTLDRQLSILLPSVASIMLQQPQPASKPNSANQTLCWHHCQLSTLDGTLLAAFSAVCNVSSIPWIYLWLHGCSWYIKDFTERIQSYMLQNS